MTTHGMPHEEAREALDALALDALDASERLAVLAHVRDCPECREELALIERTANELSYAAAPIAMSPEQRARVRARLLVRAAGDRRDDVVRERGTPVVPIASAPSVVGATADRVVATAPASASSISRWMPLAIAAGIVAVGSIGLLAKVKGERDQARASLQLVQSQQGARAAVMESLRAAMLDRDRMIASLTGPDVAVMTLASNDPASPTGRMFWDQAHGTWVFVGHHLSRPQPGRAYQLWLVTATAKISAGTFTPGTTGDAMVRTSYDMPKTSLAAIAVTEEPESGSPQPTTAPFLVAASK